MGETPVLILAYNRPDQIRGLVDSLRVHKPKKIMVGIDGPKDKPGDRDAVAEVNSEIEKIDWTDDIEMLNRQSNIGIRFAVPEAVSWAINKHGQVIVLEDDIRPGPEFFDFMKYALAEFRHSETVGHISGYNLVPKKFLTKPNDRIRASIYPESYAWATWARAWDKYDDSLEWAVSQSNSDLAKRVGSWAGSAVWSMNFKDAKSGAISTWAYRWVSSLWKNELVSLGPNRNMANYAGNASGTHTRFAPNWIEPLVESIGLLRNDNNVAIDVIADHWVSRNCFRASPFGVLRRTGESVILNCKKLG
jgi:hypothetical protein